MYNRYKQDTMIFWKGSIQKDRSARFTGKPYDEDLQAYVFPYRNYDASTARWRSSDPAGYPDGMNQYFYAGVPTLGLVILGTTWRNLDFVYHFYFGKGKSVSLSEIGLLSVIENSAINQGIQSRSADQINQEAVKQAPRIGELSKSFNNSYRFGDAYFSIGNATMSGNFDGTLTAGETFNDGKTIYSYLWKAKIKFSDTFTDPLSVIEIMYGSSTSEQVADWLATVANLGGTPFKIQGNYSWSYSGILEK